MSSLFEPRVRFKPFQYQEPKLYKEAIQHSYWLFSEFSFTRDVQEYITLLTEEERNALKNAVLAISQIEISVKKFWTRLGDRFPKAEFEQVGVIFGESEVRHSDAYSAILEKLGLNEEFEKLSQIPAIQSRIDYLSKYLKNAKSSSDQNYTMTLTLFSIFIENISLFGQFLIIKSINSIKNCMKDIDNVIQATQKEELIHARFGVWLINKIKEENPEWFNEEFYENLYKAGRKAYAAEENIVDWIFEKGEFKFLPKICVKEFIKDRFNDSIQQVGGKKIFEIDQDILAKTQWFRDEIYAETNVDFFYKKSVNYSKNMQAYSEEDLF